MFLIDRRKIGDRHQLHVRHAQRSKIIQACRLALQRRTDFAQRTVLAVRARSALSLVGKIPHTQFINHRIGVTGKGRQRGLGHLRHPFPVDQAAAAAVGRGRQRVRIRALMKFPIDLNLIQVGSSIPIAVRRETPDAFFSACHRGQHLFVC